MKKKSLLVIPAILMAIVLTSCGKVPQAEIDAATAAVDSAKAAQAEVYVPEEFTGLQDSLRVVMESIEVQKSKLFKKFDEPKQKLISITANAITVKANAIAKKEEVKLEVQTILAEVKTLLEENKTLITKAPRGKEGAAALEAIKADIATIETSLTEVETAFAAGDYMGASYKVKASKEKATEINTELNDAIAKKGKK